MPDKKLTDEKFKEILEYKSKTGCELCDIEKGNWCNTCNYKLMADALDLINRLQAENESLQTENEELRKKVNFLQASNNLNQSLLEKEKIEVELAKAETEIAKAEAYKECIHKIKVKSKKEHLVCSGAGLRTDYTITDKELDNLLKELVGEDNA